MKTLHRTMMAMMMIAVLAVAVGAMQPWAQTADAQHGQGTGPDEHYAALAQMLELNVSQRGKLAEPFGEMFTAIAQIESSHAVIAAELTDAQKVKLAGLMKQRLASVLPGESTHGRHQPDGERH